MMLQLGCSVAYFFVVSLGSHYIAIKPKRYMCCMTMKPQKHIHCFATQPKRYILNIHYIAIKPTGVTQQPRSGPAGQALLALGAQEL